MSVDILSASVVTAGPDQSPLDWLAGGGPASSQTALRRKRSNRKLRRPVALPLQARLTSTRVGLPCVRVAC
jgi:hypothetical protein